MINKEILCPICNNKMDKCEVNSEVMGNYYHYDKTRLYQIDNTIREEIIYKCNKCQTELKVFNTYTDEIKL